MRNTLSAFSRLAVIALLAAAFAIRLRSMHVLRADGQLNQAHAAPVYGHALPQLDGKHLRIFLVEVRYAPGESSPPHSHPCPVIAHVVEGTFRIQIKGEPEAVYTVGESFYEAPDSVHQISKNSSDMEPARLLAYFVCDHETPLSVPIKQDGGSSGRRSR